MLTTSKKFILASASPRRVELLSLMGLPFEIMPSEIDETFVSGESPQEHVVRLSSEKARLVSLCNPDAWVLGADTIVTINGEVLGKPSTPQEARQMLCKLSGREHTVFTGFTVVNQSLNVIVSDAVKSSVLFRKITEDEKTWYVNSKEPYDKAGGYAVQGMGAFFIKEIKGSYTNVMGLPLSEVVDVMKRIGAIEFIGADKDVKCKD